MIEYDLAKARTELARERYNRASIELENAQIRERLAEIKSQHEPLDNLLRWEKDKREQLYAAAFYVVMGRMPT